MARLFTDGAEFNDMLFWSSYSGWATSAAQKRTGGYSYVNPAGGYEMYKNFNAANECFGRFAVYHSSGFKNTDFLISFRNSSTIHSSLYFNSSDSKIHINAGGSNDVASSNDTFVSGVWYLIEVRIKIDDSPNGILTVKVEGNEQILYTGDVKNGSTTTSNNLSFNSNTTGGIIFIDDLALNDTTDTVDNSWCGDGHIGKIYPNAAGAINQWLNSGSTASSDNYTYVDDFAKDDDTTYVYCSGSDTGNKDKYNMTSLSIGGGSIRRIYSEGRARKTLSASASVNIGYLPSGGTDQLTSASTLLTTYTQILSTSASSNPVTGIAWTEADLDALQFVIGIP